MAAEFTEFPDGLKGEFSGEFNKRIENVRNMMGGSIKSLIVTNPVNIFYLSGIDQGKMLITGDDAVLWLGEFDHALNYDKIESLKNFIDIRIFDREIFIKELKTLKEGRCGIENIKFDDFLKIKKYTGNLEACDIVERARAVKSAYEIRMLRKSAEIAAGGMKKAYDVVCAGKREIDAAAEVEHEIRTAGSQSPGFDGGILLASGRRAGAIHAYPGEDIISDGMVVIDLGARYRGYYSDMTRTVKIGKISREEEKVFDFVKSLQLEFIDNIRVGDRVDDIQKKAAESIEKSGYKFYHSLGHGVGLEVQELPHFSGDWILKENMVFTVEPGIYVPGRFGVRFEDTVVLKKNGCEVLTSP